MTITEQFSTPYYLFTAPHGGHNQYYTADIRGNVLYTVIIGKVDQPCSLITADIGTFIPFLVTDSEVIATNANANGWNTILDTSNINDSILTSRFYKMHPHIIFPLASNTLYVDGNILITNIKDTFFHIQKEDTIAVFRHPYRNLPLDEVMAFSKAGVVPLSIFAKSLFLSLIFESLIVCESILLCEMNVILCSSPGDSCRQILDIWWMLFNALGSIRDQHLFPIAVLLSRKKQNVIVLNKSPIRETNHIGLYLPPSRVHRGRYSNIRRKIFIIPLLILARSIRSIK